MRAARLWRYRCKTRLRPLWPLLDDIKPHHSSSQSGENFYDLIKTGHIIAPFDKCGWFSPNSGNVLKWFQCEWEGYKWKTNAVKYIPTDPSMNKQQEKATPALKRSLPPQHPPPPPLPPDNQVKPKTLLLTQQTQWQSHTNTHFT